MTRTDATRILVFGGILLLLLNMILGEVFAIFISHVANGEIRERWGEIVTAVQRGQIDEVAAQFRRIEALLEWRGRIMNTHSHLGAFGMLALAMALLQPLLVLSHGSRRMLAVALIAGGLLQPLFIFVSRWGFDWAPWIADLGAALIVISVLGYVLGCLRGGQRGASLKDTVARLLQHPSGRVLLRGGALLILLGMLFGLGYAWVFTSQHEPRQFAQVGSMLAGAVNPEVADAQQLVLDYRRTQSRIAILTAVHSHAIEMGVIAILLAFIQGFVLYSERWRRRWAWTYLTGAYLLPVCIFNATIFGLVSAAFADLSGFIALVALAAMLVGAIRHTGATDAAPATGAT